MQLVLDSSGSMSEPAAGGQTQDRRGQGRAATPWSTGCRTRRRSGCGCTARRCSRATTPAPAPTPSRWSPPGTDNRDELSAAIAGYKPYGETPIAHALQEAGKDLGSEGHRTIVLVSDGEATCPPSPCVVARQLAEDGIDLRIDVVGLDVSGKAREQLACIADAGGGQYYDADSADDLVRALDRLSTRALRPFQVTGEPVDGGDTEASAGADRGRAVPRHPRRWRGHREVVPRRAADPRQLAALRRRRQDVRRAPTRSSSRPSRRARPAPSSAAPRTGTKVGPAATRCSGSPGWWTRAASAPSTRPAPTTTCSCSCGGARQGGDRAGRHRACS